MVRLRPLLLSFGCLALMAGAATAHDMWLQPNAFFQAAPGVAPTAALVGHGADRQRWNVDISRLAVLKTVGPNGVADARRDLKSDSLKRDLPIRLEGAGTHVVALQSLHAVSELPAARFNDYLKVEGLTPAIAQRQARRLTSQPGREIYSRRAKALVQVGPAGRAAQSHVTRPVGLSLEIVPEVNPYLPAAKGLPIQVIFEGRPLPGALVKLTNLDFDARPVEAHLTDRQGRATFQIPKTGVWLLNVVWTKPIAGDPRADFETTFSSLTFGYPRRGNR